MNFTFSLFEHKTLYTLFSKLTIIIVYKDGKKTGQ